MMKSFKILSFILALTLVFASMSTVAFAAYDPSPLIVADVAALSKLKYTYTSNKLENDVEGRSLSNEGDALTFSNDSYSYGTTAGAENGIKFFTSSSTKQSLGQLDWNEYDGLRIEADITIGDSDDGLGFRFRRYDDSNNEYTESFDGKSQPLDFYVAVGGEDYNPGTVVYGYRYVSKALKVKEKNSVIIELGSTTNDVKITVNNIEQDVIMRQFNNQNATEEKVTGLPEGSYGFCGSKNRTVLVPKTSSANGLDIKLENFSMIASKFKVKNLDLIHGRTQTYADYTYVINTTGENKTIYLIVADYDKSENMIQAKFEKRDISSNFEKDTKLERLYMKTAEGTSYSKAFVWEDLDGDIKPLITSVKVYKTAN